MIVPATSPAPIIDIEDVGLDRGARLLIKRGLRAVAPNGRLGVLGWSPDLALHLTTWCRSQGHTLEFTNWGADARPGAHSPLVAWITPGVAMQRWSHAEAAGKPNQNEAGAVVEHPKACWGLAARGATVEAGTPEFSFSLNSKTAVWTDEAARLYEQATASQWDPKTAIDWQAPRNAPAEIEEAVVQIMTYLIENEQAALLVPARFLAQIHPHFREVTQVLAMQVAEEARHVEVFTRRALLSGGPLGVSAASSQLSLKTLVEEPDFAVASFLLSVLGEGTFLNLLQFLFRHAPDPVTAEVMRLALRDEARHVAFGVAHLQFQVRQQPELRGRLARAVERRHSLIADANDLNEEVYDSLVLLAAGEWQPQAIARGYAAVQALEAEMASGRQRRMELLGFSPGEAETLSALHTRNFM
ncbi:MAG: ferritin-like domain-containing protein [Chromatiales bacterium]